MESRYDADRPDRDMPRATPTDLDRENARIRREIAERMRAEYAECLAWAEAAFGEGWQPSGRHYLVEHEDKERARLTGEKATAAATVYTVRNAEGDVRHFRIADGVPVACADYREGFGAMLLEPHPTRGFKHNGTFHHYHRYSLCWAGYDLYEPKTAEQLAVLRESRARKKAERDEREWREGNPLLAWAEGNADHSG